VLGTAQLNATVNVAGSTAYTPTTGTRMDVAGVQQLKADFTPTDAANYNTVSKTVSLTVNNVAPVVTLISLLDKPIALGTAANITAQFTDPGMNDTHTATITWDDGSPSSTGTVSNRTVTGSRTYTKPGVYTVTVTVTDNNRGSGSRSSSEETVAYVVVYDPSAGFVTGGGFIDSPVGACKLTTCTEQTVGKANFGFVSKYQTGAKTPSGNTEFQFKAGNLNFNSTDYQWLVVSGARAQYKGTGTINGQGSYNFLVTAIDADLGGSPTPRDAFRIKISDMSGTVVYDNQMGSLDDSPAATMLAGGSISIKTK
jgi:hypothetical protein